MAKKGVTLNELRESVNRINEELGYETYGPGSFSLSGAYGGHRIERNIGSGGVDTYGGYGTKAEAMQTLYDAFYDEKQYRELNPVRPLANNGRHGKIGDALWDGQTLLNAMRDNRDLYGGLNMYGGKKDNGVEGGKYYITMYKYRSESDLEIAEIDVKGMMKNKKMAGAVEFWKSARANQETREELKKELAPYIKDKGYPYEGFKSAAAKWVENGGMAKAFALEKARANAPGKVECYKVSESALSVKETLGAFAEVKGHPCSAKGAAVYSFSKNARETGCVIERKKGAGFQQFHVKKIPWGKSADEFLKQWDKEMEKKITVKRTAQKSAGGRK